MDKISGFVSTGEEVAEACNMIGKKFAEAQKEIESILAKGDRVELMPMKDGVKVIRIRREEVKIKEKLKLGTKNS